MRAMRLRRSLGAPAPLSLEPDDVPPPRPGEGEVLIQVSVCGVCRTDLDLLDGRLAAPRYPVTPGHQIVGRVVGVGRGVTERHEGDRVGVAWIRWADGDCRWCKRGEENLCPHFAANGRDADGGYAEFVVAPAAFTYAIPNVLDDEHTAPLLCAGAIGWRSLRLADLEDGDPLGLTGFGASAHLVLQMSKQRHPQSPVFVFARDAKEREFARSLGADWAGGTGDEPPAPLGAIIDTTPVWKPVVAALPRLMPGGRLVINASRKNNADRDELATIDYARSLWMEREIKSVANVTRRDVAGLIEHAAATGLRPTVTVRPLEEAPAALSDMRQGKNIRGATVLRVGDRVS